jgi:F420-0:gamma-glutamyl ligase
VNAERRSNWGRWGADDERGAVNLIGPTEIAGAAELVMGKTAGVPAAIVRGVEVAGEGSARELVMPRERDLFR